MRKTRLGRMGIEAAALSLLLPEMVEYDLFLRIFPCYIPEFTNKKRIDFLILHLVLRISRETVSDYKVGASMTGFVSHRAFTPTRE
jgi:hypothetical protein